MHTQVTLVLTLRWSAFHEPDPQLIDERWAELTIANDVASAIEHKYHVTETHVSVCGVTTNMGL